MGSRDQRPTWMVAGISRGPGSQKQAPHKPTLNDNPNRTIPPPAEASGPRESQEDGGPPLTTVHWSLQTLRGRPSTCLHYLSINPCDYVPSRLIHKFFWYD